MIDTFFSAINDPNTPSIDLHNTSNPSDALHQMEQELYRISQSDATYCRIIHGIGSGVLKNLIHEKLNNHPLVADFQKEAHGGSTVVLL